MCSLKFYLSTSPTVSIVSSHSHKGINFIIFPLKFFSSLQASVIIVPLSILNSSYFISYDFDSKSFVIVYDISIFTNKFASYSKSTLKKIVEKFQNFKFKKNKNSKKIQTRIFCSVQEIN